MNKRFVLLVFSLFSSVWHHNLMWLLFIVCGYYCSSFVNRNRVDCDKVRGYYINWYTPIYLCVNYTEMEVLTKPGILCSAFSTQCSSTGTHRYIVTDNKDFDWYCCDVVRSVRTPMLTPQHTPARTYVKLSVKCQSPAKINNLAFLTILLQ